MTMSMAWVRTVGNTQELVFATDSRLRFGCEWDCCPKLLATPRLDSAICFAGDTMYAYPIMIQAIQCITQHHKLRTRAQPLSAFKGHLIRVLNNMTSLIRDLPPDEEVVPDTTFIFGGYCWMRNEFVLWCIYFDCHLRHFTFHPVRKWRGGNEGKYMVFTGDYKQEAKTRLLRLLRSRNKLGKGGFDMEPFEVLRDMLRENKFDLIGGPPQIMKVYKHMNCNPYAIYWPDKVSSQVTLLGRPMLDYETYEYLTFDPDTLESFQVR